MTTESRQSNGESVTDNNNDNNDDGYTAKGHEEPIRKCPYCGEEKKSRGLFAHVMNSNGDGHGPYREVPDDFEQSEAEIVGYTNVNKKEPVSGSESGNELILCKICGNMAKGMHGHRIHLKKMAGKNDHPEDPTEVGEDQYRAIPADEYGNPVGPPADRELDNEYKDMIDWENGNKDMESENTQEGMFVPVEEMEKLRDVVISSREKQEVVDEVERIMARYS